MDVGQNNIFLPRWVMRGGQLLIRIDINIKINAFYLFAVFSYISRSHKVRLGKTGISSSETIFTPPPSRPLRPFEKAIIARTTQVVFL